MLLFVLSNHFREPPEPPAAARSVLRFRGDAQALLGAGVFLSAWCLLRLLARPADGLSVDVVLALGCLSLGVAAVWRGIRTLRG